MENEVYEKDYGEEFRQRSDKSEGKDFLDTLMEVGFFQKYQEAKKKRIMSICLRSVTLMSGSSEEKSGEKWAMERVLRHYDDYMTELSTLKERQPDGSMKTYVDEDLKQEIALKLLEEIPKFPMEEAEMIAETETETEK